MCTLRFAHTILMGMFGWPVMARSSQEMSSRVVGSHFQSTLWDTAISEANLRVHAAGGSRYYWASARRSMYHLAVSRKPLLEDYVRCLVLALRCSTRSPAWIMGKRFDSPAMAACLMDSPSEEKIAEFCHSVVRKAKQFAMAELHDQAETRLGEWQDPDLGWWVSNGDGVFSRAESMMTSSYEEMMEHYFHVTTP